MEHAQGWLSKLGAAFSEFGAGVIANLPNIIGAVLLLVVGWLLARLVRRATLRLGAGLNTLLIRLSGSERAARVRLSPRAPQVLASIVFWAIILVFIVAAARIAELHVFAGWLDRAIAHVPNVLAGVFIVVTGYVAAAIGLDLASAASSGLGHAQSRAVGRVAQGVILATAVVIGLDQVGIDVSFLVTIVSIVIAAAVFGVALAFGLGARALVSNLVGARELQRLLSPGQTLRVGDIEGELLELTPTVMVLATDLGRVTVPAKLVHEQVTTIVAGGHDDE